MFILKRDVMIKCDIKILIQVGVCPLLGFVTTCRSRDLNAVFIFTNDHLQIVTQKNFHKISQIFQT